MTENITNKIEDLEGILHMYGSKKFLLVCDSSYPYLPIQADLECLPDFGAIFSDFTPNPLYEDVCKGVDLFNSQSCDAIVAVGGGSAIDVAKCIKLYSGMDRAYSYLEQTAGPSRIPLIAVPTTAGTGSEATRYAVIYYNGEKQSITHDSIIPDSVILEPRVLGTLPMYQKKATMMDAFCHAVESYWSVNSTGESKAYSREAIQGVLAHMEGYLQNTEEGNAGMMLAAHTAGKAINLTQTTAGHAMCYKITSLFGCAHGHAAVLCDRVLFPWMIEHIDQCIDPRGQDYLARALDEIGQAMGCRGASEGAEKLREVFAALGLDVPKATEEQYRKLKTSVNLVRLKNHPVALTEETIDRLYHEILR